MTKSRALIVALLILAGSRVRADTVIPSTSTVPIRIPVEVSTPTIADAGETISTPTLHGMTDPTTGTSFITLTRTGVPSDRLPSNAGIVFPEEARTYDAQNAAEALSHETGILFLPQGSSSYPMNALIRGASADESLVLLDGRPLAGATLGPVNLSEIPLEQIDHIEIVRGGLSSLYGPNALAGVINVISKRAVYKGFPISHVSYEGASYGRQTYKLDFGSRQGPVDYFFFGNQEWMSGFRSNSDNSQYNIGGNAGLTMGGAGKILFDAGSYHNNAGIPGFRCENILDPLCLTSTAPLEPNQFNNKDEKPASTPYARTVTDSNYLRASYLVNLSKNVFLALRGYGQEHQVDLNDASDPIAANARSTDRHDHSKGADLQLTLPLGFLVGGSFIHDQEDLNDRLNAANSFSAWTQNWGLFAQDTMKWKMLTLIPSGRYDKSSQFGDTANPRVQALAEITEWLRLSGAESRSFRAPTINEWHLNPALVPEKAWTTEAGFDVHASSRSFHVNFFRSDLGNPIQASTYSPVNIGSARRQGVEIQLEHVVNEYFRDSWNYSYLDNRGVPLGFNHPVSLAYSPRHTANVTAAITPSKKWEIDPTLRYEDARYSGNNNSGTKMGSQLLMDLRLAYQWRQMEWFLGLKDILDKRYYEVPGYPLAGRTVYFGLRVRLWG